MRWICFLFCFLVIAGAAIADELSDQLDALRKNLTAELEGIKTQTSPDEDGARQRSRGQQLLSLMTNIEQLAADGRGQNSQHLRQAVLTTSDLSPALQEQMIAILDALPALQQKRAEEYQNSVSLALATAREALPEATEADTLNGLVGELDALRMSNWRTNSTLGEQMNQQLSAAVTTIGKWQDYLRNRRAGYTEAAQHSLQQLLDQNSPYPLIDAATIQAALAGIRKEADDPLNEVAVILESVKQPTDIPSAAQRIGTISPPPRDQGRLNAILPRIQALAAAYAAMQYGFSDNEQSSSRSLDETNPLAAELLRVENLLRLEMLTRTFADLNVGPPTEGENHESYSRRLLAASVEKNDWQSVEKILSFISRRFGRQHSGASAAGQLNAVQAYTAGQRLEAAGQFAAAIQSYRRVLTSTGDYLPIDQASERLRELSEQHKDIITQIQREDEIREIIRTTLESTPRRNPPY